MPPDYETEPLLLSQEHRMDSHNKEVDSVNLATSRGYRGKGSVHANFSSGDQFEYSQFQCFPC